jgi:CspA family cold shock protein
MSVGVGTVKKWIGEKGYGFIAPDDGGDDIFVHCTVLDGRNDFLEVGDAVHYQATYDDRKGKYKCTSCEKIEEPWSYYVGDSRGKGYGKGPGDTCVTMRLGYWMDVVDGSFLAKFPGETPEVLWVGPRSEWAPPERD